MDYNTFNNEITHLRNKVLKQEFIILNFKDAFARMKDDVENKTTSLEELRKIAQTKQDEIEKINKKLDYQYQVNEKLFIATNNISNSKEYIEMKKELELKLKICNKDIEYYKKELKIRNEKINELQTKINEIDFSKIKKGTEIGEIYELRKKLNNQKTKTKKLQDMVDKMQKPQIYSSKQMESISGTNNLQLHSMLPLLSNDEGDDCEYLSDYSMNEYIYMLTKAFEAKQVDLHMIETKIITQEVINLLLNETNYQKFILALSNNICNVLSL